jgi:hypothetical protein
MKCVKITTEGHITELNDHKNAFSYESECSPFTIPSTWCFNKYDLSMIISNDSKNYNAIASRLYNSLKSRAYVAAGCIEDIQGTVYIMNETTDFEISDLKYIAGKV